MRPLEPAVLWICRDCGNELSAEDVVLATTIGWTGLDGDTGVCPVCSNDPVKASERLLGASEVHIAESRRRILLALIRWAREGRRQPTTP